MARFNDSGPEGRSIRTLRVGEQMRHILSELLVRGVVHDPRLAGETISITEVRMSPDLRHATAFFKPLLGQNQEEIGAALKDNAGYLKGEVAKRVRMKYAAELKFLIDESFEEGEHIDALLRAPKVAQDLGEGD